MAIQKYSYVPKEPDKDGLRRYVLETHPASPICEACGAKMRSKGTSRTKDKPRVLYDIDSADGEVVRIDYWPKKYRCTNPDCNKVIPDPNAPPLTKEKGTEEFRAYLAEETLSNSKLSVKEAGAKYGVSGAYVSESIQALLKKHSATVVSFLPCSKIHIEAADCYQTPCYVVFGYADSLRMWVLLDIIEAGKYNLIVDLCEKVSTPAEICCPLDQQLVSILKDKFPKVLLKIPTDSFFSYLNDYADMVISQRSDDITKLVRDTVDAIRMRIRMGFTSYKSMEQWWMSLADNPPDDLYASKFGEPSFPDIYGDLNGHCLEGLYQFQTAKYQVPDCVERILNLLARLHKAHTPVEIVRFRLLYQAEFFRRTLKQNKQMIYRGGYSYFGAQMPQIEEWINCYTLIPTD